MTLKGFEKKITPIIDQLESQGDHYLIVHFSLKDDKYYGYDNLDFGDALLIIKELTEMHKIELENQS